MRKFSLLLSTLVLAALVLAACGGGATSTNVVESPPPVTVDATEDSGGTATEAATAEGTMTETPGVPVTGGVNPARVSNQLDFTVWSQDGEQIGDVEDLVLDMDNSQVTYVVVGTGGFLDLGEREILVPWQSLELQTGTGDATGGQQNAFILQTDVDTFSNAPDVDLGTLPEMGQPATDWDVDIRGYWEGGGAGGTANTPEAGAGTAVGDATATGTGAGAGTDQATATVGTDQATATVGTTDPGTGAGTGTDQGQPLQGVVLASEVLGSTINWGAQGQGTGTDQATATTDPGAGGTAETATADPNVQATAPAGTDAIGTDQGNTSGTIEDMITDTTTGDVLYIVITAMFDEGERWIPVPLNLFQWNGAEGAFTLNADATTVQNAPSFQDGQFPDTTTSGWNSEFDTFWQNNGGTGAGAGMGTDTQATPTP